MSTKTHRSNAERIGRRLGLMWGGYLRRERRVAAWLVTQGVPAGSAVVLLWIAKLVVLGVLLYSAFWLALLLMFALGVALVARNSDDDESEEWAIGEQAEHKNNPGYDPIIYNDTPDPRYDDE